MNTYRLAMKNLIYTLLCAVAFVSISSCAYKQARNYNDETNADQDGMAFIKNGLEGGLTEIKASSLAITNSSNPRVLSLAKMMIADHTAAGNQLVKIKADKDIISKDIISTGHMEMIHALSEKKGPDFDKAYVQMMVNDHEKAVALFAGGTRVNAPEIQDFAAKTLPTIQMHLDSSKAVLASLK
jgi:putative membrane protein